LTLLYDILTTLLFPSQNFVDKYLELFIEDYNPSRFELSILKGEGSMRNVQFNVETIQELLNLPPSLEIKKALCSSMKVKVALADMGSEATVFMVDHLDVVVVEPAELKVHSGIMNNLEQRFGGKSSAYGFWGRAVDGVCIQVEKVSIMVQFQASERISTPPWIQIHLTDMLVRQTNHKWQDTSLKEARKVNKNRAEVLVFRKLNAGSLSVSVERIDEKHKRHSCQLIRQVPLCVQWMQMKRAVDCLVLRNHFDVLLDSLKVSLSLDEFSLCTAVLQCFILASRRENTAPQLQHRFLPYMLARLKVGIVEVTLQFPTDSDSDDDNGNGGNSNIAAALEDEDGGKETAPGTARAARRKPAALQVSLLSCELKFAPRGIHLYPSFQRKVPPTSATSTPTPTVAPTASVTAATPTPLRIPPTPPTPLAAPDTDASSDTGSQAGSDISVSIGSKFSSDDTGPPTQSEAQQPREGDSILTGTLGMLTIDAFTKKNGRLEKATLFSGVPFSDTVPFARLRLALFYSESEHAREGVPPPPPPPLRIKASLVLGPVEVMVDPLQWMALLAFAPPVLRLLMTPPSSTEAAPSTKADSKADSAWLQRLPQIALVVESQKASLTLPSPQGGALWILLHQVSLSSQHALQEMLLKMPVGRVESRNAQGQTVCAACEINGAGAVFKWSPEKVAIRMDVPEIELSLHPHLLAVIHQAMGQLSQLEAADFPDFPDFPDFSALSLSVSENLRRESLPTVESVTSHMSGLRAKSSQLVQAARQTKFPALDLRLFLRGGMIQCLTDDSQPFWKLSMSSAYCQLQLGEVTNGGDRGDRNFSFVLSDVASTCLLQDKWQAVLAPHLRAESFEEVCRQSRAFEGGVFDRILEQLKATAASDQQKQKQKHNTNQKKTEKPKTACLAVWIRGGPEPRQVISLIGAKVAVEAFPLSKFKAFIPQDLDFSSLFSLSHNLADSLALPHDWRASTEGHLSQLSQQAKETMNNNNININLTETAERVKHRLKEAAPGLAQSTAATVSSVSTLPGWLVMDVELLATVLQAPAQGGEDPLRFRLPLLHLSIPPQQERIILRLEGAQVLFESEEESEEAESEAESEEKGEDRKAAGCSDKSSTRKEVSSPFALTCSTPLRTAGNVQLSFTALEMNMSPEHMDSVARGAMEIGRTLQTEVAELSRSFPPLQEVWEKIPVGAWKDKFTSVVEGVRKVEMDEVKSAVAAKLSGNAPQAAPAAGASSAELQDMANKLTQSQERCAALEQRLLEKQMQHRQALDDVESMKRQIAALRQHLRSP
jgi:hypothetical protein